MAQMNFSYRSMVANQLSSASSMNRLSSGLRINSAADDAAGLAVSERMRGQIRGLDMAYQNTHNGLQLANTAEGNLSSSSDIIVRMRELAVRASDGTMGDAERGFLNDEMTQLRGELDRISGSANYNGINLLDGSLSAGSAMRFQVGAQGESDQRIEMSIGNMSSRGLGLENINLSTIDGANSALAAIDRASEMISDQRGSIGAVQNRLEHTMNNIGVSTENLASSESRIRDLDMAFEAMRRTQSSIMNQTSQAMMSQAMNLSRGHMMGLLMR